MVAKKKKNSKADMPVKVKLIGGQLLISVGIDTLVHAFENIPDNMNDDGTGPSWKVVDPKTFAKDVLRELLNEEEDGTTTVHMLFDNACLAAMENGSEGVDDAPEGEKFK